jgi:serine protease inhibitor
MSGWEKGADHPFVFIIGEETSGTILFEGVYTHP